MVTAHVGIYHRVAITDVLSYHKFLSVLRKEDVSENIYVVLGGIFDGHLKSFWLHMGTTNRLSAPQGEGERTHESILDHRNLPFLLSFFCKRPS